MVLAQRVTAEETFELVPPLLAITAGAYQRACIAEDEQLASMGRHDLLAEWSDDVRSTVLQTRARVHEAQQAREQLREQLRALVINLRGTGERASAVLRRIRSVMDVLESTSAVNADGGRLESELLSWAIEDYEAYAAR